MSVDLVALAVLIPIAYGDFFLLPFTLYCRSNKILKISGNCVDEKDGDTDCCA